MDAVEFVKAYRRMCGRTACAKCPLWEDEHYACMMDARLIKSAQASESEVVSVVEQWAKEHPTKTRQSEFLKMFPNAQIFDEKALGIYPCKIDKTIESVACSGDCTRCRCDYWLQEVE